MATMCLRSNCRNCTRTNKRERHCMSTKIRTNTSTKIDSVDFGVYTGAHEDTPGLVFHFSPQLQWKRVGRDRNGGDGVRSGGREERNKGDTRGRTKEQDGERREGKLVR